MKLITTFILVLLCTIGKGQSNLLVDGKLNIDSFYKNKEDLIINVGVLEFEGLSKEQLKTKIKNWGAINYVNLKEVFISETDDQIVLNYIDKSMFIRTMGMNSAFHWYIRLVIQFKDGKIRCMYYDDGNALQPSTQYTQGISSRTYHLNQYFKESDGVNNATKAMTNGMIALKESININMLSIKDFILKKETISNW
jgi:hypothetical protein